MIMVGRVVALCLCLISGFVAWLFLVVVIPGIIVGNTNPEWWDKLFPIVLFVGYLVGIAALLLPGVIGWSVKIRHGARNPSGRELAQFEHASDRLHREYETLNGRRLPRLSWQVVDAKELNAMAFPARWIVVSNQLLRVTNENGEDGEHMLYGILAHEVGHIHYGDTSQVLWMSALLWSFSPFSLAARLMIYLCGIPASIPIIGIPFYLLSWIFVGMIWICAVPAKIAWYILGMTSRAIEFRADRFAFDMKGGRGLQLFLETISGEDVYKGGTIMDYYQRSHPPVELRLDRLVRLSKDEGQATEQSSGLPIAGVARSPDEGNGGC